MNNIRNFVKISNNIGTSGQPAPEEFSKIAASDYKVVVNLAMPEHQDSIANEGEIVTALGMTYIHLPVAFDHPQPDDVKAFCKYMTAIEGEKVLVHCIMNYRVSAFMYHYLHKVVGLDEDKSKSEMFLKWNPDDTWLDLLSWSNEKIGL